jgi:NADH dehydrogenase
MPGLAGEQIRWMLLDTALRLLPELEPRLSRTADRVLRRRGVEVRTGQSVATALDECWVQLSTGEKVPTYSLIWCIGVRADPLVAGLDLDTNRGGWWLMSSWPCPARRTSTPAAIAPRCPT